MKRLSVRLSLVGAIIALGGFVLFQSLRGDSSAADTESTSLTKGDAGEKDDPPGNPAGISQPSEGTSSTVNPKSSGSGNPLPNNYGSMQASFNSQVGDQTETTTTNASSKSTSSGIPKPSIGGYDLSNPAAKSPASTTTSQGGTGYTLSDKDSNSKTTITPPSPTASSTGTTNSSETGGSATTNSGGLSKNDSPVLPKQLLDRDSSATKSNGSAGNTYGNSGSTYGSSGSANDANQPGTAGSTYGNSASDRGNPAATRSTYGNTESINDANKTGAAGSTYGSTGSSTGNPAAAGSTYGNSGATNEAGKSGTAGSTYGNSASGTGNPAATGSTYGNSGSVNESSQTGTAGSTYGNSGSTTGNPAAAGSTYGNPGATNEAGKTGAAGSTYGNRGSTTGNPAATGATYGNSGSVNDAGRTGTSGNTYGNTYGDSGAGTGTNPTTGNSNDGRPKTTEDPAGGYGTNQTLGGYGTVAGSPGMAEATPGDANLEGAQTPTVTIEKKAPAELQVNRQSDFVTLVRNTGRVSAHNVVIMDRVPQGTRLIRTVPEAQQLAEGVIAWTLGTLEPGQEQRLSMTLMPLQEGNIGSVATVSFQARASVKTVCTKPMLEVKQTVRPKVMIGDDLRIDITVSNPGTGDATGVVLEEDVPDGLVHPAGKSLEYDIGTIKPGQSKRLALVLKARKAGQVLNRLVVRGVGELKSEHSTPVEVVAPSLQLEVRGPRIRYLNRAARLTMTVSNPGTASARNVDLEMRLPKGLKFVSADHQGQYSTRDHAIYWSLEELPPGEQGSVKIVLLPQSRGTQTVKLAGRANLNVQQSHEYVMNVQAIPELVFTISDSADPIEVGSETSYEIQLENRGSRVASQVQMIVQLPPGMTPGSKQPNGAARPTIQDRNFIFPVLRQLAPGQKMRYQVTARGQQQGDHIIRVQVQSADVSKPVAKEEITTVYADTP